MQQATKIRLRWQPYWQTWLLTAAAALQITMVNRWASLLFFIGKLIRLGTMLILLLLIKNNISVFAGYTPDQIMVFFLIFQFIDTIPQIFLRGAYTFAHLIRNGEFDSYLNKPLSPLWRVLTRNIDVTDVAFLLPLVGITLYLLHNSTLSFTLTNIVWFAVLFAHALLLSLSFHIFVLVFGIITVDVDSLIWLYRDISRLTQFPADIYAAPLKFLLMFILPVGTMVTIPAQVLLGTPPFYSAFIAILISWGFFALSYSAWRWALTKYTSANG